MKQMILIVTGVQTFQGSNSVTQGQASSSLWHLVYSEHPWPEACSRHPFLSTEDLFPSRCHFFLVCFPCVLLTTTLPYPKPALSQRTILCPTSETSFRQLHVYSCPLSPAPCSKSEAELGTHLLQSFSIFQHLITETSISHPLFPPVPIDISSSSRDVEKWGKSVRTWAWMQSIPQTQALFYYFVLGAHMCCSQG